MTCSERTVRLAMAAAVMFSFSLGKSPIARGAIVFDNDARPVNVMTTTLSSSDATASVRAEDFVLATGASTITGLEWTGSYASALVHLTDSFMIQFFDDAPFDPMRANPRPMDLPSFIVSIPAGDANRTINALGLYEYSETIAPLTLLPGVRYWVSIFNDASDEPGEPAWLWAGTTIGVTGSDVIGIRNGPNWGNGIGFQLDFRLLGDMAVIPEASSLAVWSLLACVVLAVRLRVCRCVAGTISGLRERCFAVFFQADAARRFTRLREPELAPSATTPDFRSDPTTVVSR